MRANSDTTRGQYPRPMPMPDSQGRGKQHYLDAQQTRPTPYSMQQQQPRIASNGMYDHMRQQPGGLSQSAMQGNCHQPGFSNGPSNTNASFNMMSYSQMNPNHMGVNPQQRSQMPIDMPSFHSKKLSGIYATSVQEEYARQQRNYGVMGVGSDQSNAMNMRGMHSAYTTPQSRPMFDQTCFQSNYPNSPRCQPPQTFSNNHVSNSKSLNPMNQYQRQMGYKNNSYNAMNSCQMVPIDTSENGQKMNKQKKQKISLSHKISNHPQSDESRSSTSTQQGQTTGGGARRFMTTSISHSSDSVSTAETLQNHHGVHRFVPTPDQISTNSSDSMNNENNYIKDHSSYHRGIPTPDQANSAASSPTNSIPPIFTACENRQKNSGHRSIPTPDQSISDAQQIVTSSHEEELDAATILCNLARMVSSSEADTAQSSNPTLVLSNPSGLTQRSVSSASDVSPDSTSAKSTKRSPVCQDVPYPTRLATKDDAKELNSLHCFLREELLELFIIHESRDNSSIVATVSNDDDELSNHASSQSKSRPCGGRVGLRCVHCSFAQRRLGLMYPENSQDRGIFDPDSVLKNPNASMSMFYPRKLSDLYKMVCNWQRVHYSKCKHIPPSMRRKYSELKSSDKTRGKTAYWVRSAMEIGLVDDEKFGGGVRLIQ